MYSRRKQKRQEIVGMCSWWINLSDDDGWEQRQRKYLEIYIILFSLGYYLSRSRLGLMQLH